MRYIIGIDPGLGETGVVFYRDNLEAGILDWATYSAPHTDEADISRVVAIASAVVTLIMKWVNEYGVKELDIGIELPVYTRNPATYTKQVRLLQEIQSGIFHLVAGNVNECWVTEVNPITSKTLACHSRAKKAEMVAASPFAAGGPRQSTLEALADAWAHGLATWKVGGTRFPYHTMTVGTLEEKWMSND